MARILVAGAGHGGLVAAKLLAEAGHDVTVFEKSKEGQAGLDQKDSLDASAMDFAGIEIPESYNAPGNRITFVPLEDDVEPVTIPANENYRNLTVERREFIDYLSSLAADAGAKFVYETEILGPVMLGSRVGGIRTSSGDFYGDMIIDACGVHSPVRNGLPDFTQTEKEPAHYDILHAYRAYFKKVDGVPDPEHRYSLYIKEDGSQGFRWAITDKDCVDVLLLRFSELSWSDVAEGLRAVNEFNPQMDKEMIRGGFADIPVRQPAAVFVADGYAAVGDSAFMTYPVKGSGMAYSIKAGKLLADAVNADEVGLYTAETLWEYEKSFFKEIGYDACRLAAAKSILPYFTAKEVNEVFRLGLVTSTELSQLFSGEFAKTKLPGFIKDKIKILNEVPEFRAHMATLLGWVGKVTAVEPFFPEKYSREDMIKWRERYNKCFDSMRRTDTEE